MLASKEYLDNIAKKLDALNKAGGGGRAAQESYKMPSFIDQVGITASEYLKNRKAQEIKSDPLFPDRNTY